MGDGFIGEARRGLEVEEELNMGLKKGNVESSWGTGNYLAIKFLCGSQELPFSSGEVTLLYGPGSPSMGPGHMDQNHPNCSLGPPEAPEHWAQGTPLAPNNCGPWAVGTQNGQKHYKSGRTPKVIFGPISSRTMGTRPLLSKFKICNKRPRKTFWVNSCKATQP
ncbi:hypothetical protein O181_000961 [Austropuccinia psidii MF-1]|uniref:Uncharacterized protein n=1 Tax=Austropuccinia psidii MF-1 TaxID=1389203 RepID=A0A9Q3GC02_9BASI|nr:hypothetical protein [Austropuccinia psidii MF-1]